MLREYPLPPGTDWGNAFLSLIILKRAQGSIILDGFAPECGAFTYSCRAFVIDRAKLPGQESAFCAQMLSNGPDTRPRRLLGRSSLFYVVASVRLASTGWRDPKSRRKQDKTNYHYEPSEVEAVLV